MPTSPTRREFLQATAVAGTLGAIPNVHAAGERRAAGRPGRLRRPRHRRGRAGARPPTRTSSSSPWPTPSRTGLQESLATPQGRTRRSAAKVDVRPERRFVGFDAYRKLIDSGVDVVLLCTPPHFRPLHLRAAVEAGKHVFAEKPVAVDAPGVRSVLETCELAKSQGPLGRLRALPAVRQRLPRDRPPHPRRRDRRGRHAARQRLPQRPLGQAAAAGLDRDDLPDAELVQLHLAVGRLQRRAARPLPRRLRLGDEGPVPGQGHRHGRPAGARPGRSTARSTTISPSSTSTPTGRGSSATAGSSRAARTTSASRCSGTQGRAELVGTPQGAADPGRRERVDLRRPEERRCTRPSTTSCSPRIRSGKPINNGEYMARSTLLAIMGRMAAYTGQQITWEMALNSQEDLSPAALRLGRPAPASRGGRARARRSSSERGRRADRRPETDAMPLRPRTSRRSASGSPHLAPDRGRRARGGWTAGGRWPGGRVESRPADAASRPGSRSPA